MECKSREFTGGVRRVVVWVRTVSKARILSAWISKIDCQKSFNLHLDARYA